MFSEDLSEEERAPGRKQPARIARAPKKQKTELVKPFDNCKECNKKETETGKMRFVATNANIGFKRRALSLKMLTSTAAVNLNNPVQP